jgi:hypothetical protein
MCLNLSQSVSICLTHLFIVQDSSRLTLYNNLTQGLKKLKLIFKNDIKKLKMILKKENVSYLYDKEYKRYQAFDQT